MKFDADNGRSTQPRGTHFFGDQTKDAYGRMLARQSADRDRKNSALRAHQSFVSGRVAREAFDDAERRVRTVDARDNVFAAKTSSRAKTTRNHSSFGNFL